METHSFTLSHCLTDYREIIDESDVFIDVHKAIRRMAPAPKARVPKGRIVSEPSDDVIESQRNSREEPSNNQKAAESSPAKTGDLLHLDRKGSTADVGSPPPPIFKLRNNELSDRDIAIIQRGTTPEIREHLKHLGPSNLASRPRQTRYSNVKIKRGSSSATPNLLHMESGTAILLPESQRRESEETSLIGSTGHNSTVRSAGKSASDAVQAVRIYGATHDAAVLDEESQPTVSRSVDSQIEVQRPDARRPNTRSDYLSPSGYPRSHNGTSSSSPVSPSHFPHGPARSGSITEQVVDSNGIRKVILQTSDSHSITDEEGNKHTHRSSQRLEFSAQNRTSIHGMNSEDDQDNADEATTAQGSKHDKKKRRRKRRKQSGSKGGEQDEAESQPLLD